MNKQSWLLNLSLLKTHPAFRAVFLARFISIVSLGLLGVAVPVQGLIRSGKDHQGAHPLVHWQRFVIDVRAKMPRHRVGPKVGP